MREDQVRSLMTRAGAKTGPPFDIDVAEIMRRGHRIRRVRRRLVVAGSSVATVATVVAVALVAARPPLPPRHLEPATIPPTLVATTTSHINMPTGPEIVTSSGVPTTAARTGNPTSTTTPSPDGAPATTG